MCAYLYLGAQVCRYMCVVMHVQARGQPWVLFLPALFVETGCDWVLTCGSPIRLAGQ